MNVPWKHPFQKEIQGHELFINGESSKTCTGAVGIILSKNSTNAWIRAGSLPPINRNGRIMGLQLDFATKKSPEKIFVVSVYLPCTSSNKPPLDEDFISLVEDLKKLIQKECGNDVTSMIGGDFNSILGTRKHWGCDSWALKKSHYT